MRRYRSRHAFAAANGTTQIDPGLVGPHQQALARRDQGGQSGPIGAAAKIGDVLGGQRRRQFLRQRGVVSFQPGDWRGG